MRETAQERAVRHGEEFYEAHRYRADDWTDVHPATRERLCDDAEELFERWRDEVLADAQAAVNQLGARMASEPSLDRECYQEAIGDVLAALETLRGEASHGN